MAQSPWVVGQGRAPVYRKLVHYRSQQALSLREAIELATTARRARGPVVVVHRDRRCDATDPGAVFLLGIDPGDALAVEVTGPVTPGVLEELEHILARMGVAPRGEEADGRAPGAGPHRPLPVQTHGGVS